MSKLWRVAWHEYRGHVWAKGFVIAILSVPLLLALIIGLGTMTEYMKVDRRPVGYVDHSGSLAEPGPKAPVSSGLGRYLDKSVRFIAYDAQDTAHNALESGDIQAYYVLAADYPRSRQVELVHIKPPGENATDQFWNLLQTNLLADEPAQVALRAEQGSKLTVRTPDGSRQVVEGEIVNLLLPMLLSIVFMILFMSTSTTLMQAIVQEKDSRTMEILATSLSPGQLIGGKVLAVAGMGLTLFASWVVCIAVALFFAGNVLGAEWARGISIAPQALRAIIPVAVPSYVLYCALMTALAGWLCGLFA